MKRAAPRLRRPGVIARLATEFDQLDRMIQDERADDHDEEPEVVDDHRAMQCPGADGSGEIKHRVSGAVEPAQLCGGNAEVTGNDAVINIGDEASRQNEGNDSAGAMPRGDEKERPRESHAQQRQREGCRVSKALSARRKRRNDHRMLNTSISKTSVEFAGILPCARRP